MALLHYANLEAHRPDILLQRTFNGLTDFHKYLENTKKFLESSEAVKRLRWKVIDKDVVPVNAGKEAKGVWIQLVEVDGSTHESVFKSFLDENNEDIYEADNANWKFVGSPASDCPACKDHGGKPKMAYKTEEHALEVASNSQKPLKVYECEEGYGWHLTKRFDASRVRFNVSNKISILDRDPESEQLLVDRVPRKDFIVLRPNTYTLKCQIDAIQALQSSPSVFHRPLLRLFESNDHAKWGKLPNLDSSSFVSSFEAHLNRTTFVDKWYVLTDASRPGTLEQRKFVEIALNTPDFAFMEGPPGSGKTTAILELIIQLVLRGKRILLCASTHVAVDNVLERIIEEKSEVRDAIIALRIGDKSNISEKVKPYQLERFLSTERKRLQSELQKLSNLSEAQQQLLVELNRGNSTIQRMALESANLICGTTIGILKHPDIKDKNASTPQFDFMIIDEASKTTFQEFLVPALLAKRWVLVGDKKQLSPYVDDESMAVNITPCLPESYKREACLDVFNASDQVGAVRKRVSSLVLNDSDIVQDFYRKQGEVNGVLVATPKTDSEYIPYSSLVVGDQQFLGEREKVLPLDIIHIRGNLKNAPHSVGYRKSAIESKSRHHQNSDSSWESEIAWRMARQYEQRLNGDGNDEKISTSQKLSNHIEALLPFDGKRGRDSVSEQINRVKKVALPSILESLQSGFQRTKRQRNGTALSDGLPDHVLMDRVITLKFQHRMHPDIASFSHHRIYNQTALNTPDQMIEKRFWSYRPDRKRSLWVDVKDGRVTSGNRNPKEAEQLIAELVNFDKWAMNNPKKDGKPWEVAVLSFYRGQERELRARLRRWSKNPRAFRHFSKGDKRSPYIDVQVCTVDKFQGHEADLVLLSFMNSHATSFLESPNRLNVAVTRARYAQVIFGNRNAMKRASGVLAHLAEDTKWSRTVEVMQ
ncbi:AAA domain-containing protein [Vibrio parahaemolyticus]|uniref:AAA domain-containing protein n=1 Tax=Vibrio parahaemolyticus TaxID=670 RepID=UPI00215C5708|nr:AAA domain-containing protein [Vibrio parahaemolyticus]MCS0014851.1 AAA domain-containing protein [Vibrio parahaemolyticus]